MIEFLKKYSIVFSLFFLMPFVWIYAQRRIDYILGEKRAIESVIYIPSGNLLRVMSFGYTDIVANMLWMRTTLYFGTQITTVKEYQWLYRFLDSVTDLDPLFRFPYLFGGIILTNEASEPENSNKILYKALIHIRDDWRMPFFIGFNYFMHLDKKAKASHFFRMAAEFERAPDYVKGLYVLAMYEEGYNEVARILLLEAMATIQDEKARESLMRKVKEFEAEDPYFIESVFNTPPQKNISP